MNKRVIVISDFNFQGSGYLNIIVPICVGLEKNGYDLKAIGFGYTGVEHPFNFTVIPCKDSGDASSMLDTLRVWKPAMVIIAMDIPHVIKYAEICERLGIKVIAITALENPPLSMSWSYALQKLHKVFFISQAGTDAAVKAELLAEHILVGMDTESWRLRTLDEYTKGRESLNIKSETKVIITVADNQERKNLSKAMEIVSKFKKLGNKVKYILVTREKSQIGWNLRDLAMNFGIASELMIFERGITFKELYTLYAISDYFLLTSKGEGLCMPVLEAMSVGVPVIAPNCGSMPELLGEGRGWIMDTEYTTIDPYGNQYRIFPSAESGVEKLGLPDTVSSNARKYLETRTLDVPVRQLIAVMESADEAPTE
jgi:glycosyltransferase involved in cell wall biosynthesis